MISVLARLRVEDWDRFRSIHDEAAELSVRERGGNLWHRVLRQVDDPTDVVFLETWSSPQDADDYYFSDHVEALLNRLQGALVELIKIEETDCASIDSGPGIQ